jgi:hypothetical protein
MDMGRLSGGMLGRSYSSGIFLMKKPQPSIFKLSASLKASSLYILIGILILNCNREFENPSDPNSQRYTVKSESFLKRIGEIDLFAGDTLRIVGGVTSQPVVEDGLPKRFEWDLDGDGKIDTTTEGPDTLSVQVRGNGDYRVGLTVIDKAGFQNLASLAYRVHPNLNAQFRLQTFDPDCPAYAQVPVLMRIALALSQFTVEKTKEEGFSNSDYISKIAGALTGTGFPIGALDGFDYSYSKGVYRFRNGTFYIDLAFHYGPGIVGHAEGDTIRANLFDLDSYVRITDITLFPPSVKYSLGPLADLIEGNIQVNIDNTRHPKFDFQLDFNTIQFSFSRNTRTWLLLSNQEITLANALFFTIYEGKARMAPTYPQDLIRLYGKDSLELDFSGSRISSPELSLSWHYTDKGIEDTAVYRIALFQETLRQSFRFGNSDGIKKVFGDYTSINRLGDTQALESVYFKGNYSSTGVDSAQFYCSEGLEMNTAFGVATFETATKDQADFKSSRYGYAFHFPFAIVEPWSGNLDQLPIKLREWDAINQP